MRTIETVSGLLIGYGNRVTAFEISAPTYVG